MTRGTSISPFFDEGRALERNLAKRTQGSEGRKRHDGDRRCGLASRSDGIDGKGVQVSKARVWRGQLRSRADCDADLMRGLGEENCPLRRWVSE